METLHLKDKLALLEISVQYLNTINKVVIKRPVETSLWEDSWNLKISVSSLELLNGNFSQNVLIQFPYLKTYRTSITSVSWVHTIPPTVYFTRGKAGTCHQWACYILGIIWRNAQITAKNTKYAVLPGVTWQAQIQVLRKIFRRMKNMRLHENPSLRHNILHHSHTTRHEKATHSAAARTRLV